MAVAYMISAEQRAIETGASVDISHSNILLEHTLFFTFCSTKLVVRLRAPLGRCWKSALNSILRTGIESVGSNYPVYLFRK